MSLVWYEKGADKIDGIIFQHRVFDSDGSRDHLLHFHCGVEIVFIVKGEAEVFVDNDVFVLRSCEICYVEGAKTHKFCYKKGSECYVVVLSPGYANHSNCLDTKSFATVSNFCEGFSRIKEFLDFSYKNWCEDSLSFKQGFADMLIGLMSRYYPMSEKSEHRKNEKALFDAVKYINDNCKTDLNVKTLALKFGYTQNYFSAIFCRFVGMSFRDYINRCRILEYMRLKKGSPDVTAQEMAEMCGFGSVKSFYRAKKKFENDDALKVKNEG